MLLIEDAKCKIEQAKTILVDLAESNTLDTKTLELVREAIVPLIASNMTLREVLHLLDK